MSKILKMKSAPILNVTDFYRQFDILDVIKNREACVRFALGHFRWSNSINLHHIDVLQKCCDSNSEVILTESADYWKSDEKGFCKNPCNTLAGYETQKIIVDEIFRRFEKEFLGQERRVLLLVIASVLLGNQTEACLQDIRVSELKAAYKRELGEEEKNVVKLLLRRSPDLPLKIELPFLAGSFRLPFDPKLWPSSANRYQTWVIRALDKATLELYDARSNEVVEKRELESDERLFCLVLNETVVKILPNIVKNGKNTLERKKDRIYLNKQRCGIPSEASSFAVGAAEDSPWLLYVCDGHVRYVNSDGIGFERKASEQIEVIAEVCVVNGKAVIVRNDGEIWNGKEFVSGGEVK